nr:MAG TPA: hypothetical protein [Caudoviricetes sp.]
MIKLNQQILPASRRSTRGWIFEKPPVSTVDTGGFVVSVTYL